MASIDDRCFYSKADLENMSFIKFPTALFEDPEYRKINDSAKILYAYMYDMLSLSIKNNWVDDAGRVYIKFSIKTMMEKLGWGNKKCGKMMEILEQVGLIARVRPNRLSTYRIYVRKISSTRCQSDTSRDVKTTSHEMSKRHTNHTNYNHTDFSSLDSTKKTGKKKKQFNNFTQRKQDLKALEDAWVNRPMEEVDTG